jgi:hypothetical protein
MTSNRKSPSKAKHTQSIRAIDKKTRASGDLLRKVTQLTSVSKFTKKLIKKPTFIDFHPFDDAVEQWELDALFSADADSSNEPIKASSKVAMAEFSKKITDTAKHKPADQKEAKDKAMGERPGNLALVQKPIEFRQTKSNPQQQKKSNALNTSANESSNKKLELSKLKNASNSKFTSSDRQTSPDTKVTAKSILSVLTAMTKATELIEGGDFDSADSASKQLNVGQSSITKVDLKKTRLEQRNAETPGSKNSISHSDYKHEANQGLPPVSAVTSLTELVSKLWQVSSGSDDKVSPHAMDRSTNPVDHSHYVGSSINTNDPFAKTAIEPSSRLPQQTSQQAGSTLATGPAPSASPSDLAEAINGVLKEQAWLRGTHLP